MGCANNAESPLAIQIRVAAEDKKTLCVSKGWRVYRNKQGEEVKIRQVLEKLSVWVKGMLKVIDKGVAFDRSGHAALPWGIVKYLMTVLEIFTRFGRQFLIQESADYYRRCRALR